MEVLHTFFEKQKEQHIQKQDDFSIPRHPHEEILESRAIVEKRDLRKMRPESTHINDVFFVSLDIRLFPKDGAGFLEQLPNNFRSGYLMAEIEE